MTPRRYFYYMYYPEESKKMDEAYRQHGIYVVNTISYIVKDVIVPFFIPQLRKNNKTDSDYEGQ